MSGACAHFSFLVHSPNVMKECAPTPLDDLGPEPLHTLGLRWDFGRRTELRLANSEL